MARRVTEAFGADGRAFLAGLPGQVAAAAQRWGLRIGDPFGQSIHWVAAVTTADGSPAVLKLGPPGPGHLLGEATALDAFAGRGAVRLLAHDPGLGALLLERADPGTEAADLVPGRDAEATAAAIGLIRELHRPVPAGCPLAPLADRQRSFERYLSEHPGDGPLPRALVERAAAVFAELCASAPRPVVLHGDLHHGNILRSARGWLAIDPHGVIGDPLYDTAPLLYNPDPFTGDPGWIRLVPDRIAQLAEGLGAPPERIAAWGFVQGILSEVWTTEGSGTPGTRALAVARLLAPLT
ncbi:MAG: streptomycin 6-kinase [Cryptosporangiaceae bacterium]|nr:streptomycin 6-kinase [Cryptosporangiaceae bacterium]